jgi:hypothetical protein
VAEKPAEPVAPAPVSAPEAPAETLAETVKPVPAAPVHTGPVFETVVVTADGNQDKPAEPPAPKKGWWSR